MNLISSSSYWELEIEGWYVFPVTTTLSNMIQRETASRWFSGSFIKMKDTPKSLFRALGPGVTKMLCYIPQWTFVVLASQQSSPYFYWNISLIFPWETIPLPFSRYVKSGDVAQVISGQSARLILLAILTGSGLGQGPKFFHCKFSLGVLTMEKKILVWVFGLSYVWTFKWQVSECPYLFKSVCRVFVS